MLRRTKGVQVSSVDEGSQHKEHPYEMKIVCTTVDKLGINMYDKVTAAVAEVIANSYDADATTVTVIAPLGEWLTERRNGKEVDRGYTISVKDDGHGMTHDEVNPYYLIVGADRRKNGSDTSPIFNRKVLGHKGVGKLAPFGICRKIEVLTSGGSKSKSGYRTSHLILITTALWKSLRIPTTLNLGRKMVLIQTKPVLTFSSVDSQKKEEFQIRKVFIDNRHAYLA